MQFSRAYLNAGCAAMFFSALTATGLRAATPVDQYLSTGDNHYVGSWLPLDSPAAIDASFDLLKNVFNTRRIYWRGLDDQTLVEAVAHPEHVVAYRNIQWLKTLINDRGINDYAVQAAHARGMEIWGQMSLYDWGSGPDVGVYSFPSQHEHPLRVDHPEWIPVDKYGVRLQGGPLEYAYPGARQAAIDWIDNQVQTVGYDGVLFHTYAENYGERFGDEFGFSDPIVQEFKSRYGVDLRRDAFNKEDFQRLRGEYTTTLLQELHDTLAPLGAGVGMGISPIDTDRPQLWLGNQEFPTAGNIQLNWQKWAQDGSVDEFVVWGGTGSGPTAMNELINGTQGTGVGISAMTSSPYALTWNQFKDQGFGVTAGAAYEWQYLVGSNIPVQPKSSLNSPDPYLRMRTLSQVVDGTTSATASEVMGLLNDSNVLNRRIALTALGKIGGSQAIAALENALMDGDSSVRNAAIYALLDANRTESITPILNAIDAHGEFIFLEGAFNALITRSEWVPQLVTAARTHADPNVRFVAMRSLATFGYGGHVDSTYVSPIMVGAQDSDPAVRAFAIDALGTIYNSPDAVQKLVDSMASTDTIISARAAQSLSYAIQRHDPATEARRAELIGLIGDAFEQQGDGTQRADKNWAYRRIGNALLDIGNEGTAVLTQYMNQRYDRRLSELAWKVLHLPIRTHVVTSVTEAEDAYAHFKRPRWDKLVAASDDFSLRADGATIHNQTFDNGATWIVQAGAPADNIVQSQYAKGGGKALKTVRRHGDYHFLKLAGHPLDVAAAEITTVTAKADWMHLRDADSTTLCIGLGGLYGPTIYIDPGANYRIWQSDGTVEGGHYIDSGFDAGTGGWETIEIVLTFAPADANNMLNGAYDVFLSRGGDSSRGALPRTLIADDVSLFSIPEHTAMSLIISNQTDNVSGDVTTYWDNVSLTIDRVLPSIAGDADLDGDVDLADLGALATHYGTTAGASWLMGNFDADNDVDLNDLGALATNYGFHSSSTLTFEEAYAIAFVPEPAGLSALVAIVALVCGKRTPAHREGLRADR